jgi:hypothetical protein
MNTEAQIAHFLRLAEDEGATQAERDLAGQQAERLMVKYGITRIAAEARDNLRKVEEKIVVEAKFFGGLYAEARMEAAYTVARAFGLQGYISKGAYGRDGNNSHADRNVAGIKLFVVGHESDLRDVLQIIDSLDVQAALAVKVWAKEQTKSGAWYWHSAPDKTLARATFLRGFGSGAAARITASREAAVAEAGNGTDLVLVERAALVKEHYNGLHLGKSRARSRRYDSNGYAAGRTAGYNASTSGSVAALRS